MTTVGRYALVFSVSVGDLVLVRWQDAEHAAGWIDEGNTIDDYCARSEHCHTLGVVKEIDSRGVILCQSWHKSAVGGCWFIPTDMIVEAQILRRDVWARRN